LGLQIAGFRPLWPYHRGMDEHELAKATSRVGEIVEAAERAAEDLRAQAEARMRDRIAEGDRAAANRVEAAEAEALEMLANAQEEAEKIRDAARVEARQIVADASAAAREVLRDGTELSGNVRELSDSLRINAELLLRDIRLAHAEMTARLDQADATAEGERPRSSPRRAQVDELDVPEFHPGSRP
jgi:F0F1-type ATP synthase membrane subunit b/b'